MCGACAAPNDVLDCCDVWATDAAGCWLSKDMNQNDAKNKVAKEFPDVCGACSA